MNTFQVGADRTRLPSRVIRVGVNSTEPLGAGVVAVRAVACTTECHLVGHPVCSLGYKWGLKKWGTEGSTQAGLISGNKGQEQLGQGHNKVSVVPSPG